MGEPGFVTVNELGGFLKLSLTEDVATQFLIDFASDMVRDYLQQQIDYTVDDVITLDPRHDGYVFLPELPVVSVSKLETFDGYVWTTIPFDAWTVSAETGLVAAIGWTGTRWPTGPGTWRVTYTHGYEEIPNSIKAAALGLAARVYSSPVAVASEGIGGYQVKYATESAGFSTLELAALNRYKVPRIA
jgi:hypothetical protein